MMLDTIDAFEVFEDFLPVETGRKLIEFMNEWCAISARRDITALDALLPEDLVSTTSDGRVLTKSQYLAVIESIPADFRLTAHDQTVQIVADTGIVRAVYRVEYPDSEATYVRTTATFVKRFGKWVVVAVHSNVLTNSKS